MSYLKNLTLFVSVLSALITPGFVRVSIAAPPQLKDSGNISEAYITPTSTPTYVSTSRPVATYTNAEIQKMKEEGAIKDKENQQKYEEYIKNRTSQSLTSTPLPSENSAGASVETASIVTPTPTPVGITEEELQKIEDEETDKKFIEEMREEARQDYIKKGLPVPEDEINKLGFSPAGSQVLTPHEMKKQFGNRKERYEVPITEALPGCMYVPGFRDPDLCLDDNNNVIYKRGQGAEALENLKRRYGKN